MRQKLSAMRYIKNNKRRVAVLVISLGLCFMLTYLTNVLLMSTEETFKVAAVNNARKIQYVRLAGSSLGVNIDNPNYEELVAEYNEKNLQLIERLKKHDGVEEVYFAQNIYNNVVAAIGQWGVELPLLEKEQLPSLIEHYGTKLYEGRMPENPGEIVLDRAAMSNGGYHIGDYFDKENYDTAFKIVGILEGENYWGCGVLPEGDLLNPENRQIMILSDGSISDVSKLLEKEGIYVRDTFDNVYDVKAGEEDLKENVTDVIITSTNVVYAGVMILLSLALFIVYTTYLRDRHNEWCLYCSIGYSRGEIYRSIVRELAFSFGIAIVFGVVLTAVFVVGLDYMMIKPAGLRCRYLYPETIGEILCSYMLLFGVLQIPVRYALHRIRTIDAVDDDLY